MIKLTKKQAIAYKKKWRMVERVQAQESQTTPMSLKFKQLCILMNSFPYLLVGKQREREISNIRQRWMVLKRRWEHGRS